VVRTDAFPNVADGFWILFINGLPLFGFPGHNYSFSGEGVFARTITAVSVLLANCVYRHYPSLQHLLGNDICLPPA
jgi:hypothetical protein